MRKRMKKIAIVVPATLLRKNIDVLCFDPASDTIKHESFSPSHKKEVAGSIIDSFLEGDRLSLIDLSIFYKPQLFDWLTVLNNKGVLKRIASLKAYVFCDALDGGLNMLPSYAAYTSSLVLKDTPFVALHNMATGEAGTLKLPLDFTKANSLYAEKKDLMTEYNRDWIGGATFINGHYVGDLDFKGSTSCYGGKSIIKRENLDGWLPTDESNQMTVELTAIENGKKPVFYSW